MPLDLLTLPLPTAAPTPAPDSEVTLRPLEAAEHDDLAALYLASYPPGVAAADLAEARREIADTFAGAFGVLRPDASATAWLDGRLAGAVLVVERSIWDPDVTGPFVIDLFVAPAVRGRGAGGRLLRHVVDACARAGDPAVSLRIGDGTSEPALQLYRTLGFVPTP